MTDITDNSRVVGPTQNNVRERIAGDLLVFAALLERPLDRDVIVALWSHCYEGLLALDTPSAALSQALEKFCRCLTDIPTYPDPGIEAALLADYERVLGTPAVRDSTDDARRMTAPSVIEQLLRRDQANRWLERYQQEASTCPAAADAGLAVLLRRLAAMVLAPEVAVAQDGNRDSQPLSEPCRRIQGLLADVAVRSQTPLYGALAGLTIAFLDDLQSVLHGAKGRHGPGRTLPVVEARTSESPARGALTRPSSR
jgi:hypothetical protein